MRADDYWDLDHVIRLRNELDRLVKALDDRTIAELHRRAGLSGKPAEALQEGAGRALRDGYGGGSSGVAVAVSGVADPVLSTVTAYAGGSDDQPDTWRQWSDPMVRQVELIFDHLAQAVDHAAKVQRLRRRIEDVVGPLTRPASECWCCRRHVAGGPDRLRGGYCDACRKAWERDGRPGNDPQEPGNRRLQWEADRRRLLDERQVS